MRFVMKIDDDIKRPLVGSLKINDNINARSTCTFKVDADNSIAIGQEVTITNDVGTGAVASDDTYFMQVQFPAVNNTYPRVFGGTIERFKKRRIGTTSIVRYNISCIDFNKTADRRRVYESYVNKTAGYIVNDIITRFLAGEGITAGSIETGPVMKKVVFNYKKASECFDYIKDATGLNWNIDYNKQLNTFYREDDVGEGFSTTEGNFEDVEVESTREEYRNRQYIRAGKDLTDTLTKRSVTPKPDGVSRTFMVSLPIGEKPTIYVNDVAVSDSDVGINGVDTGKKWYWNKGSNQISQDDGETVLCDTDALTVTYKGLFPIIVQADNQLEQAARKAVEGGTGIYEDIEVDGNIDDSDTALDYANGLLEKYADIPEIVTITTREFRQAGKLIPLDIPELDLSGDYLIESVQTKDQNGLLVYTVKALSGESLGGWVEFFRKMRQDKSQYLIRENEVLIKLKRLEDGVECNDSLSYTSAASESRVGTALVGYSEVF